jgi:hypothetical protein
MTKIKIRDEGRKTKNKKNTTLSHPYYVLCVCVLVRTVSRCRHNYAKRNFNTSHITWNHITIATKNYYTLCLLTTQIFLNTLKYLCVPALYNQRAQKSLVYSLQALSTTVWPACSKGTNVITV